MDSDLKSELAKVYPDIAASAAKPVNPSVKDLYQRFCSKLKDTSITDPLKQEVFFRIENFPYLIKLEYFSEQQKAWISAKAGRVIKDLQGGSFKEEKHRIDPARAKGMHRIPEIIRDPDSIHKNSHHSVTGELIYVRKLGGRISKVALTTRNRSGEWVLVTSFFSTEGWLKKYAKKPPLYEKGKAAIAGGSS